MSSYKHYVIQDTDKSIESIAFKIYKDMEKWRTLVNLNNLEYPYLVDSPQQKLNNPEHLVTHGDLLLLPNDANVAEQADKNKIIESNTPHYAPHYYDTTLGMDLNLNVGTDVPLSDRVGILEPHGGDLKRVTGLENLKQSLILRILTRKGTLLMHPNYGSWLTDMLGKPMNNHMLQDVAWELQRTITSDTRVQACVVTKARLSYDEIFLDAEVTPIGYDKAFDLYLYRSSNGEISFR